MNLKLNVAIIVEAHRQIHRGLDPIMDALKDQSIPLDERWEAYNTLVKNNILVKNVTYGDGFLDTLGNNMTLYDDFNIERHNTETFISMYDRIMEADPRWDQDLVEAQANLPEWQEKVLASGYSSFTYDW